MESWKRVITRDLGIELEGLELGKDMELGGRERPRFSCFWLGELGRKTARHGG